MRAEIRYDEDCALLRDEVRRWLGDNFSPQALRQFVGEGAPCDEKLWHAVAELGWVGLALPEEYGGAGMGAVALCVLLEETGRALLPAPLLPSVLAARALLAGGSEAQCLRWLPDIACGRTRAALALVDVNGDWDATRTAVVCEAQALRGEKRHVWGAATADLFIVPFVEDGGARCAVVESDAPGVQIEPEITLDRTRPSARVRFDGVPLAPECVLVEAAPELFGHFLPWAWTALAAEAAGGADALLAMTAAYTATRKQFGKPIGGFQAVKHPLVNVLVDVEKTRSLVYGAATAIDAQDPAAERYARMAKAQASDAFVFAASRAVQLHGGYGFTEDCDAHYYLKRARGTRPAFGDATHHRKWIGRALRAESAR